FHLAREHLELVLIARRRRAGGARHLAFDAGALSRLADIAGRLREFGAHVQAATVEILRRLGVELHRLGAGLADADKLQEAGPVGVRVLAEPRHLLPEAVHGGAAGFVAEVGQIRVDVVLGGAPLPRLDRAAAGDPDRRVRVLDRPRPDVDVALLIEAAVEREGVALGPRP